MPENSPEVGIGNIRVNAAEIDAIEHVEEFELQLQVTGLAEEGEAVVFDDAGIDLQDALLTEGVTRTVALRANGGRGEIG